MNKAQKATTTIDWSQYTIPELEEIQKDLGKAIVKMRAEKKLEVKEQVFEMIKAAGFTPSDLGFSPVKKTGGKKRVLSIKYKSPETGETWTGVGRTPGWLASQLEAGKTLEDFRV